ARGLAPAVVPLVAAMPRLRPDLLELFLLIRRQIQFRGKPVGGTEPPRARRRRGRRLSALDPHRQPGGKCHQETNDHDYPRHLVSPSPFAPPAPPAENSSSIHWTVGSEPL